MKRIYYIFGYWFMGVVAIAQSVNQNYILTTVPTVAVSDPTTLNATNSNTTIQYFDGLGRPMQTVQKGITPTGKDLVSIVEYDGVGREYRQYLPAPLAGNNGAYVPDFGALSTAQYGSNAYAYNETKFEASPLNRVLGQQGAGTAWQGHASSVDYLSNIAGEVARYSVTDDDKLKQDSCYDKNTLYKTKTKDEDKKPTYEFKDKQGQLVLKQSMNSAEKVNTYYVYDDFGRLRYVLPPLAADALTAITTFENNNDFLVKYAYLYQYDERGNCIYKRLPGCEPIDMVYDRADRMVLSQDGNQRIKNQWTASKYDVLGRIIYTGIINSTLNREAQKAIYDKKVVTETYTPTGYTCTNFCDAKPITIHYYDNYNFLGLLPVIGSKIAYNTAMELQGYDKQYSNAKGLLTGTLTYTLDRTNSYVAAAMYYDERGRIVQSLSNNHLGGVNSVYNMYNFNGSLKQTLKTLTVTGTGALNELYTYSYDLAGRLIKTSYRLNNSAIARWKTQSYDELGRLVQKTRHNTTDTELFEYNIRNWATRVKSGAFDENLYYNSNLPDNSTPCHNGNIAASTWTHNGIVNGYTYQYDNLNRLTDAYGMSSFDYFSESFTFDKLGNIKTLMRSKDEGSNYIDALELTYNGNQIKSIYDDYGSRNQYNIKEYQNKSNTTVEFAYDANGNMTKDLDRDIVTIRYNLLNLPDTIQFRNGGQLINLYDASGRKLSTRNVCPNVALDVPLMDGEILNVNNASYINDGFFVYSFSEYISSYIDNVEFKSSKDEAVTIAKIDLVSNEEGYTTNVNTTTPTRFYYRRDHLGNIREVWNANNNTTIQRTQYYPSGLPWAANADDNPSTQNRKYNGKEFVEMHGYDTYDYGARGMYAAIGRFSSVDPLCEKYYSISPYAYCAGNPVKYIDPTGMSYTYNWDTREYQDGDGNRAEWSDVKNDLTKNNTAQDQKQQTIDCLETLKNSCSGLYNQIQTCAASVFDIFSKKNKTTLPNGYKSISYSARNLSPDYTSVDLSGSAYIPFLPAIGGGFDLSLGYVRNDGLFLLGGTRAGAGFDFSISGGLSFGLYSGKAPLSAISLSGKGLHLSAGFGPLSYSLLQDISSQYGMTSVGSNWTINSISVGVGLTPANVSITQSNSFKPYYLLKK